MNFPRSRRFLLAAALSLLAVTAIAGCDMGNPAAATPTTIRANSPATIPTPISTVEGGVPQGVGTGVPAPVTTAGPNVDIEVEVLPTSTVTAP